MSYKIPNRIVKDVNGKEYNIANNYTVGYKVFINNEYITIIFNKYKSISSALQALTEFQKNNLIFQTKYKLYIFEVWYIYDKGIITEQFVNI